VGVVAIVNAGGDAGFAPHSVVTRCRGTLLAETMSERRLDEEWFCGYVTGCVFTDRSTSCGPVNEKVT